MLIMEKLCDYSNNQFDLYAHAVSECNHNFNLLTLRN